MGSLQRSRFVRWSDKARRGPAERVECPCCGRDVAVSGSGRVYPHKELRMGSAGPYIGLEYCIGGQAW